MTTPNPAIIEKRHGTFNKPMLEKHGWEMRLHRTTLQECWIKQHSLPRHDGTEETILLALHKQDDRAKVLIGDQCLGHATHMAQVQRVLKAIELNLNQPAGK
jgi:hypothetical protein